MFEKLNNAAARPSVWSAYTADILWTEPHIAKQMLVYHLDPELNVASRSRDFIEESLDWLISENKLTSRSKTIDFGCGPGLYTHGLKSRDIGTVVGVDFSQNSLGYAKRQAESEKLEIEYHYANYLSYNDPRKFDLISLVMCDFCALNPQQRSKLLCKFKSMLAVNGVIALDVYTATRFAVQLEQQTLEKNAMDSFWSAEDYWCLQSSFRYESELVSLDKYVIFQKAKEWTVYNWLQHFTLEMLNLELKKHGLQINSCYSDLRGSPLIDDDEMAVLIGHV